MQDPARRKVLESKYDFTNRDFVKLSGSVDMFNFLGDQKSMVSTVYYDTGNGFNPKECISQRSYINNQGNFQVSFDLSDIKNIQSLRFDPFENSYIQLKNVVITLDGKDVPYNISSHTVSEDGYVEFDDGDPQYIIDAGKGKVLTVMGATRLIGYDETMKKIKTLQIQAQQTTWQRAKQRVKRVLNK